MCGLLHCVHQNEKLMFWKDNLAHATPASFLTIGSTTYVCRGAILDVGLDMPDPGMVPNGAKCGEGKVMWIYKVVKATIWKGKCSQKFKLSWALLFLHHMHNEADINGSFLCLFDSLSVSLNVLPRLRWCHMTIWTPLQCYARICYNVVQMIYLRITLH